MRKILVGLILVLGLFALLFASPLFKIKNIELNDDQKCLSRQSVKDTNPQKNLLLLQTGNLQKALQEKYSCIDSIRITKKFPSTISITLEALTPVAKIGGTEFAATKDGLVIKIPQKQLPTLYISEPSALVEGSKIEDQTTISALAISRDLAKTDYNFTSIRPLNAKEIAIYSTDESVTIFSPQKDKKIQIDSLQAILARAKMNSDKIAKIDLRFDKPVITYK